MSRGWRMLQRPGPAALFVAGALLLSTSVGVFYVHRMQTLTAEIVTDNFGTLQDAEQLAFTFRDMRRALMRHALTQDAQALNTLPHLASQLEDALEATHREVDTPLERRYMQTVAAGYQEYLDRVAAIEADGGRLAPEESLALADDVFGPKIIEPVHAFLEENNRTIEAAVARHQSLSRRLQLVLVLAGFVLPLAGVAMGYLISTSVTRQLSRSRDELLRAEQLAAVGQLAAGVAHEIRNPLTSIKMMVQTAGADDPPDFTVIEEEIKRMESTIQSVLDFARPPRPRRTEFDLRDAVAEACQLVEGRIRRQQAVLSLAQSPTPLWVSADRHQVHQAMVNLLINALDSVGSHGQVQVGAREIGDTAEVRVSDNGPGVEAEMLPRIFEPFVSTKATGTGLGLSITKRIVEGNDGRIEAGSSTGGGAEFIVIFQRHKGSEACQPCWSSTTSLTSSSASTAYSATPVSR